jgi:hypothetical protein
VRWAAEVGRVEQGGRVAKRPCLRSQAAASGNEPQGESEGEGPLRIGRRPSDESRITTRCS